MKTNKSQFQSFKYAIVMALLFAVMASFTGCSSVGVGGGSDGAVEGAKPPVSLKSNSTGVIYLVGEPVWKDLGDVRKVLKGKAQVQGNTLYLGGMTLSGKKMRHPSNSQDERSPALRVDIEGFTIRDGVVDDVPGGIILSGDNMRMIDLTFTNVGEDALSSIKDTAQGTVVRGCRFYNGKRGDKSLQLNDGRDTLTVSNYFTGGMTAMRLVESTSKNKNQKAQILNNKFENVRTAVNVDGTTTVTASGNVYQNVFEKWKLGPNANLKNK